MGPKRNTVPTKVKGARTAVSDTDSTVTKNGTINSAVSIITEQDILNATSKQQLVEFINELTNTKKDQLFEEYKAKAHVQLQNSSSLIQQLNIDVIQKQQTIDALLSEVSQLKQAVEAANEVAANKLTVGGTSSDSNRSFESPIRRKQESNLINQDQLQSELEDIGVFLDLIELLTGIQIVNYVKQHNQYLFDIQQTNSNKSISINYRLVIDKQFKQNAEVNYIPTFMEEATLKSETLQSILPEYLCENLSFNLSTLGQFYGKVSKALNKKK